MGDSLPSQEASTTSVNLGPGPSWVDPYTRFAENLSRGSDEKLTWHKKKPWIEVLSQGEDGRVDTPCVIYAWIAMRC